MNNPKLVRITTIPGSLRGLLKDQLQFMNQYYEVIAVSSPGKILDEVAQTEGVKTFGIEMSRTISPLKDIISLYKLIIFFKKEKPEIVHTHTPKAGFLGMLAAWLTKVPVRMHTVAGMPLMEATGLKKNLLLFIEKLTYKCSGKIYPNSAGLKKYILENKLALADKVKVIGKGSSNGIDLDFFNPANFKIEDIFQLKPELLPLVNQGQFNYIYIGRIVKDKGINELVAAFVKLVAEKPKSNLLLVGDFERKLDPLKPETEVYINNNKNIHFLGYQKDIRPFLSIAKVMVFPSYREGLPNVLMQAGSFNLPIVCTNITGCADIVQQNINGLLVNPKSVNELYNAMYKIQDNDKLYNVLKQNARESIKEKYIRSYLYNEIHKEYELALNKKIK